MAKMKKWIFVSFVLVLSAALAACGSSGQSSGSNSPGSSPSPSATQPSGGSSPDAGQADAGGEENKSVGKRIAFFSAGASNNYLINAIEHAEKTAKELGMEIDIFDGRFDALAQFNQIQNAIATGKYDGFVVEAVDGNQVCKILTEDAVNKGIAVSAINVELCGVTETAAPGTLTFVGGQTLGVYQEAVRQIFTNHPEGGKIAAIAGPATGTNYKNFEKALELELPNFPQWQLVGMYATDYTANQAFQVAQNVIQANRDLKVIFSNYSGMTVGVVKAKEAAKRDDILIYDFGGDEWAFEAVEKGEIQSTIIMLPKEEVQRGIEALHLYFNGKEVPPFYDLTKEEILPGTMFVNKDNIEEFRARGLPEY